MKPPNPKYRVVGPLISGYVKLTEIDGERLYLPIEAFPPNMRVNPYAGVKVRHAAPDAFVAEMERL